jgi:hypothetical protein
MSDDRSKTVADRKRINIHEEHELRYWSDDVRALTRSAICI